MTALVRLPVMLLFALITTCGAGTVLTGVREVTDTEDWTEARGSSRIERSD